jgi:hypothetical protein
VTFALLSVLGVFAAGLAPAVPAPSCAENVLNDWYDGALEGTYEAQCYRDALDAMPEDVRVYTTAVDDISRALRRQLAGDGAAEAKSDRGSARSLSGVRRPAGAKSAPSVAVGDTAAARRLPAPVLALVALVLVLAIAASGTMVARRVRRTRAGPARSS